MKNRARHSKQSNKVKPKILIILYIIFIVGICYISYYLYNYHKDKADTIDILNNVEIDNTQVTEQKT